MEDSPGTYINPISLFLKCCTLSCPGNLPFLLILAKNLRGQIALDATWSDSFPSADVHHIRSPRNSRNLCKRKGVLCIEKQPLRFGMVLAVGKHFPMVS